MEAAVCSTGGLFNCGVVGSLVTARELLVVECGILDFLTRDRRRPLPCGMEAATGPPGKSPSWVVLWILLYYQSPSL